MHGKEKRRGEGEKKRIGNIPRAISRGAVLLHWGVRFVKPSPRGRRLRLISRNQWLKCRAFIREPTSPVTSRSAVIWINLPSRLASNFSTPLVCVCVRARAPWPPTRCVARKLVNINGENNSCVSQVSVARVWMVCMYPPLLCLWDGRSNCRILFVSLILYGITVYPVLFRKLNFLKL